jgi:hypothetical protein
MSSNGRRVAVVAIVAAIGVIATLWISAPRNARGVELESDRGPAPERNTTLEGSHATGSRSDLPGATAPTDAPIATRLVFRSSAGLPISSVELEIEERTWQRRPLENGSCAADGLHLPVRARAPGHLTALANRPDEVVVLEPDALIVIEGEGLRTCLRTIRPLGSWTQADNPYLDQFLTQIAEHLSFGFVDDDHWACAATPRELFDMRYVPYLREKHLLEIDLEWRDRRIGHVRFDAKSGARAVWKAPCDDVAATGALEVTIERPAGAPRGEIELRLHRSVDSSAQPTAHEESWGRVQLSVPETVSLKERQPADADRIRIEDLPLGDEWFLAARDLASGAMGSATFVHDGSPRNLVLAETIVLRGRLIGAAGFPPPSVAWFHWEEPDPRADGWIRSNWSRPALGPEGVFELRGWENPPYQAMDWAPPPSQVSLACEVPGFERLETVVAVGADGSGAAGVLELRPMPGLLHLEPGHRLENLDFQGSTVRISSAPGAVWELIGGRPTLDGGLDLCLQTEGVDPEGRPLTILWDEIRGGRRTETFPPSPFEALILNHQGSEGFAFKRATGGGFERVGERVYELDVDCSAVPADGWNWTLLWSWRGMKQSIELLGAEAIGERRTLRFSAPEEGTELRWLASDARNSSSTTARFGSGSITLDAARVRIRVP